MLFRNVLAFICILGLALAIPVKQKRDDDEYTTEIIVLTTTVIEDVTDGVEIPEEDDDNEKKIEEIVTPAPEDEDVAIAVGEEKSVTPVNPEEETETPFIPENEEPDVDTTICSKDLLLMGNKVESHHVCDEIYDACTKKELISIIMYYYSKSSPVSIEYTINEGINKTSISEKCGNILINSKIFQDDTTVIEGDIETPEKAEKVTDINQDIPTEASDNEEEVKEAEEQPELGDNYAEYSEDDIEENI